MRHALGLLTFLFACLPVGLFGQLVSNSMLLKPPANSWPTYNGDYSGRRFSSLKEINSGNVKNLQLAWTYQANAGATGFSTGIKATPLLVDGVLYFTEPDNAWAVDARSGRELWHYKWESQGGIHIGNRGVGIYHDWLFFETPDDHLISLEAKTGKFRWSVVIADLAQEYFSTPAPIVIGNHIVVGVGGDSLDVPGYLEARDPETGAVQWHWNTEPRPGEPGAETWPGKDSMEHGGGMTWNPGTYDPELNLLYWGTGNPNPVHAGQSRKGADLWTCSLVALNPDTGKLVWYYQVSPHDTHDFDATQTPILFDAVYKGKQRKLLAQASRNGFFFLLDRTNGEHLLTSAYIKQDWATGINDKGQPIENPKKEPQTNGTLVSPASGGATNWFAPSYDPGTGLFYVNTSQSYSIFYLTDTSPKPEGFAGRDSGVWEQSALKAIDPQTGQVRWSHAYTPPGGDGAGILSTAGHLLFTGDPYHHFVAFDPETGRILWHTGVDHNVSNGAITYELDGHQYVLVSAGDVLYSFTLPR